MCGLHRRCRANEDAAELSFSHVAFDAVNPDCSVPRNLIAHAPVIDVGGLESTTNRCVVTIYTTPSLADRLRVALVADRRVLPGSADCGATADRAGVGEGLPLVRLTPDV